jgi:hypothetical protein
MKRQFFSPVASTKTWTICIGFYEKNKWKSSFLPLNMYALFRFSQNSNLKIRLWRGNPFKPIDVYQELQLLNPWRGMIDPITWLNHGKSQFQLVNSHSNPIPDG